MPNNKKISFLPSEMKRREEKELKKKGSKEEELKFHIPQKERLKSNWTKPLENVKSKRQFSFWEKIFGTKEEIASKKKKKEEERRRRRIEKEKKRKEYERKRAKKKEEKEAARRRKKEEELRKAREKREREELQAAIARDKFKKSAGKKERIKTEKILSSPPFKKDYKKKNKAVLPQKNRTVEEVAPGMRVSLVPEELLRPLPVRFYHDLLLFIFIQALILFFILLGYLWMDWQESQVSTQAGTINDQLVAINRDIKNSENNVKEAKELQNRINLFGGLLKKHIYWTKFLALLEKNTVNGVYYTSIAADANGKVILSAKADSYTTIARQLVAMKDADNFASEVKINSAVAEVSDGGSVSGITFDMQIKLTDGVFNK